MRRENSKIKMEFDEEQEEQQQEQEIGAASEHYRTPGDNSVEGVSTTIVRKSIVRYRECLKNHAVGIGGHALDGCGEFMPAGEEGILSSNFKSIFSKMKRVIFF